MLSWFRNAQGALKIALKEDIGRIPMIGASVKLMEFILLKRDWKEDKQRISLMLQKAVKDDGPLWFLLFPEGTVICQDTMNKTMAYAAKKNLPDRPKNVLIPKSTGLHHSLLELMPRAEYLYDLTIGYSDVKGGFAYDKYSLSSIFFQGKGPRQVHIHVKRYRIQDLPGITLDPTDQDLELFNQWLRDHYLEKDKLMNEFYEKDTFPVAHQGVGFKQVLPIHPHAQDIFSLITLLLASVFGTAWMLFI